jgi:4-coumarate--CoA ligase (photoactive yellow protein activation family)
LLKSDLLSPHLQRIICDLLVAELRHLHPQRLRDLKTIDLDTHLDIREQFDLDSLDLMRCATAVATLFNIYDSGFEDALLARRTISAWHELIAKLRQEGTQDLTFATSGSMGKAKHFRHDFDWLKQEAMAWADNLGHIERVVVCVPSHHIYGAIWTCLLPEVLKVPVLMTSIDTLNQKIFLNNDLLVTVPPVWDYLAATLKLHHDGIRKRVFGVSSTAPLKSTTHDDLIQRAGFSAVWQIYGSTETAGLAYADHSNGIYTWLPYLHAINAKTVQRRTPQGELVIQDLPDEVILLESDKAQQTFALGARNDDVVKVGGHRVSLQKIEQSIKSNSMVSDCLVRYDEATQHLKTLIILSAESQGHADPLHALESYFAKKLPAHELPRQWQSCHALPINSVGKHVTW